MTPVSLHPTPPWRAVMAEQRHAIALVLRRETIVFALALMVLFALSLRAAFASVGSPTPYIRIGFAPGIGIPMVIMALFIPLSVWRGDDATRRAYHWAMPVPRARHTLAKVAAGAVWVMAAVAAYLLFIEALVGSIGAITGRWDDAGAAAWEYFVPFTASAITYAIGSAIAVGVRHPSRWISGLVPAALMVYLFPRVLGLHRLQELVITMWQGYYGLAAALGIGIQDVSGHSSIARWGAASLLWGGASATVLMIAVRRYIEEQ